MSLSPPLGVPPDQERPNRIGLLRSSSRKRIMFNIVRSHPYSVHIYASDKVVLLRTSNGWDTSGYQHSCLFEAWQKLQYLDIHNGRNDDIIVWNASPSRKFSLKIAYGTLASMLIDMTWSDSKITFPDTPLSLGMMILHTIYH